MPSAQRPTVVLHADQEHGGIRFAVFIALFFSIFLGFQLLVWLLEAMAPPEIVDYTTFLACVGSIPFALVIIWGLEKILKRVWHSGLSLVLDDTGITVNDTRDKSQLRYNQNEPENHAIRWSGNLMHLKWYFKLSGYPRGGRERRIPAKWMCLATELVQDESRLNVFTFMPPDDAARWIEDSRHGFQRINQAELAENSLRSRIGPPSRPTLPNELIHSKEGRYWLAERRRWQYGVELSAEDFVTLLDYTQAAIDSFSAYEANPQPDSPPRALP